MRKVGISIAACLAATTCAPAIATTAFTAAQYASANAGLTAIQTTNLIVLGNATLHSDVEGKAYVGGNLTGNSATIGIGHSGKAAKASSLVRTLTVGGNLTGGINVNNGIGLSAIEAVVGGNSGTINVNLGSASSAKVMVAGTFDAQNYNPNSKKTAAYGVSASNVQTQDQAYVKKDATIKSGGSSDLKSAIAAETTALTTQLADLSMILGALTPDATLVSSDKNNIHFNFTTEATSATFAVANITASQLASGTYVLPTYADAKTLVVNVSGTSVTLGANASGSGATSQQNIIYNFTDATTVAVNTAIYGTVLAPKASLTGSSPINGSVVAKVFNSSGEVHLGTFSGQTPFLVVTPTHGGGNAGHVGSVPEPSSWMTMLFGFGALGSIIRYQRRKERLAAA